MPDRDVAPMRPDLFMFGEMMEKNAEGVRYVLLPEEE